MCLQKNLALAFALLPCLASADLIGITGAGGAASILYEFDSSNATTLRTIGSTGLTRVTGIAFHPTTGELYAHRSDNNDTGQLYRIDLNDVSNPTLIGTTNITSPDLAFRSDGTLFGWLEFHDNAVFAATDVDKIVTFDLGTGAATILGDSNILPSRNALAFDSQDNLLFKGSESRTGPTRIYSIDQTTGAATAQVDLGADPANALAIDSSDTVYTIDRRSGSSFLQTIDLATGQITEIGDLGIDGISSIAFSPPAAIPEPSSLLLTMPLTGAAIWLRRRKRT